jgi:hypothetical protein
MESATQTEPQMCELANAIEALVRKHPEPWYVVKEPHKYPNGTTHFTHVRYTRHDSSGGQMRVEVANHVTPELGELLCVLHNNIDAIIEALRKSEDSP